LAEADQLELDDLIERLRRSGAGEPAKLSP
jgi:hypothetical protein